MNITLEQARTLVAVARHRSFAKAARELHKVHSAVVYSIKSLEEGLDLKLFDRSGYRSVLTPLGTRVVEHCAQMLLAESSLAELCAAAKSGEEPTLKVVFDGLLPVAPLMRAVRKVGSASGSTRVSLFADFLGDVESRFQREDADVMITVIPPNDPPAKRHLLASLTSLLVAQADHPLAKIRGSLALADLASHTFLTVRGSDRRLRMSTTDLDKTSVFHLSDFYAKKAALMQGMGYGWMPEHLITGELARKTLKVLVVGADRGRHVFRPELYCRESRGSGRALSAFVEDLKMRTF